MKPFQRSALCSLLCTALLLSIPIPSHAAPAPTLTPCQEAAAAPEFSLQNSTAYQPLQALSPPTLLQPLPTVGADAQTDALPTAYDLRSVDAVTSVKNQGLDGMCWAFSTLGAAESNLLLKKKVSPDNATGKNELDLSEEQLRYLFVNNPQPLSPTHGDYLIETSGGNALYAAFFLSTTGVQLERFLPYSDSKPPLQEYQRNAASYRMTASEITMTVTNETQRNNIKKQIMEKGAMYVAFYTNSGYYYDNGESYCYYQNKFTGEDAYKKNANHAVLIVGWDDNYSASNFPKNCRPSANGAWLARNSWGSGKLDDGYFWMSYEEPSLGEFTSVTMAPREEDGTVYYYDGAGYASAYQFSSGANVYYAEQAETLSKVGIYQCSSNGTARYTVKVYALSDTAKNPTDGTLLSQTTVESNVFGYQEIPLPEPVHLLKGERFSVVLSAKRGLGFRSTGYLTIEENMGSLSPACYQANPGQSYVYSVPQGGTSASWQDVTTVAGQYGSLGNLNIHAIMEPQKEAASAIYGQAAAVVAAAEEQLTDTAPWKNEYQNAKQAMLNTSIGSIPSALLQSYVAKLLSEMEADNVIQYPQYGYLSYPFQPGDVNEDGKITVEDAVLCLTMYAKNSVQLPCTYTYCQQLAADVNGNLDAVTVEDATEILRYYAEMSAGLKTEWKR